jgi:MscS family membrane protein
VEQLNKLWNAIGGDFGWMIQIFVLVTVTFIVGAVVRHIVAGLAERAQKTRNRVDDVLFGSLVGPSRVLVWIVGLSFAAQIIGLRTEEEDTQNISLNVVGAIRNVGIISVVTWFVLRFINNYEASYIAAKSSAGEKIDKTLVNAVRNVLRAAVIVTAGLIALQTMGININGLLAFGGVGGITVGFAAKELIANMFGGLTIYIDKPFGVGDWIRSPDREIEGTVEEIGLRVTVIRTFDKRPLYVPNAVFTTIAVENPSRMSHRRIRETIGVRYDDIARIPKILEDIRKYLNESPEIDQSQTLMVNVDEFGASSVDFFIYTFTRTTVWTEFHTVKEKVMLAISDIIAQHGGEIAFPTTTVHVPEAIALIDSAPGKANLKQDASAPRAD